MATASDDGTVHVFHSTVYSDLLRDPLIVPVKVRLLLQYFKLLQITSNYFKFS